MKKNYLPKKEYPKQIASVLVVILMIVWSLGTVLGFVAFFKSCERDEVVTASAMSSEQLYDVPYSICLGQYTTFYLESGEIPFGYVDSFSCVLTLETTDYRSREWFPITFTTDWQTYDSNPSLCYVNYDSGNETLEIVEPYYVVTSNLGFVNKDFYLYVYSELNDTLLVDNGINNEHITYNYFLTYYEDMVYDYAFEQGKISGLEEGRSLGFEDGRIVGYNEGANASNTYTFNKFFSSIIDVPIQAFTSLFNFEFLGINLANFFLSLLTVAIILAIIRFVL